MHNVEKLDASALTLERQTAAALSTISHVAPESSNRGSAGVTSRTSSCARVHSLPTHSVRS